MATEKIYRIEQGPKVSAANKLTKEEFHSDEIRNIVSMVQQDYLPWQEFRKKSWASSRKEKIWSLIEWQRSFGNIQTVILDQQNLPFEFNPNQYGEFLHTVDLELGGNFMGVRDFSESDRREFIRRSLIEESIASSQLEGANTSRSVAKKMLQEGRAPKDESEQMIVNNHETMQWIENDLKNEALSFDLLCELHRKITHHTIEPEHQGVLRDTFDSKGNRLVVKPWDELTIAYVTPTREFVEKHLPKLIEFANDREGKGFIHPLIKAIMLHFWIGYLHPFEDGNGRLARTLFYWYMLRKGYWAFSFLALSERILKSPKQYSMAYIYSEQDNNDLNYFIHYNIKKLELARQQFSQYVERKMIESRQSSSIVRSGYQLNARQIRLLQYLAKDEQRHTNLKSYWHINSDIGEVTAATDLKKLVEKGFLEKVRSGRNIFYYPTAKIKKLIG